MIVPDSGDVDGNKPRQAQSETCDGYSGTFQHDFTAAKPVISLYRNLQPHLLVIFAGNIVYDF